MVSARPRPGVPEHSDYAERSRITQQRILDSAVEVLVESGYRGASTLRIQERAGVSRGRLLHQYPHRDALLVAAVAHIAEARVEAARAGRTRWPATPAAHVDAAVGAMWHTYEQAYFWAAMELWLAARHNPRLAAALAPRERALGAAIRAAVDEMFGPELTARPAYPGLREILTTSMRGVALTYAFETRDRARDPHLRTWRAIARHELGVG